jgi:hypothetical protein
MARSIGNLMMLGLLSLGHRLIIMEDGNHFNTMLKDFILILLFLPAVKDKLSV